MLRTSEPDLSERQHPTVEFGVFLNGYIPGPAAHISSLEHEALMREIEYTVTADKYNWKYAWFGEHHALTEYSHMSAGEVVIGHCAAKTERIHLGSAIVSLPPKKEHPVRIAERAAMLDHICDRRYEFGTGRGAGSHEVATFGIMDTNDTKSMWDEVIRQIPRMWEERDYQFEGEHFVVPTPHNILPKPYAPGHPPIWVACGNPGTFTKAGQLGIGAIAFNFEPIFNLRERVAAYKEAIQSPIEQIGQYKNDNVMMTNAVICLEDRKRAREIAMTAGRGYLVTMVNLYHDTMPKSPDARTWPEPPVEIPWTEELLDQLIEGGYMLCGTPEEVCEQVARYGEVGCDQVVFGLPGEGIQHDEILEMLEVFGTQVIPEFDKDPVHSTDRYREQAKPAFQEFNRPLPDIKVEILPNSALAPLS